MARSAQLSVVLPQVLRSLRDGDVPRHPEPLDGPPVLVLHGFGTSSRVLLPLARHLGRALGRPVLRCPLGGALPLHVGDVRASAARVNEELERLALRSAFAYVDVVGHSLGGLVATYLLKRLDRGRRVRRVVTLGTPHGGTPAAWLGVALLGLVSRAVWQMLPGAPLLRELAALPVPEGAELLALASDRDAVVPEASVSPAPRQHNLPLPGLGHVEFLSSRRAFHAVASALA